MELLKIGNKRRSTATTENNTYSSRSHSVFTLIFKENDKNVKEKVMKKMKNVENEQVPPHTKIIKRKVEEKGKDEEDKERKEEEEEEKTNDCLKNDNPKGNFPISTGKFFFLLNPNENLNESDLCKKHKNVYFKQLKKNKIWALMSKNIIYKFSHPFFSRGIHTWRHHRTKNIFIFSVGCISQITIGYPPGKPESIW